MRAIKKQIEVEFEIYHKGLEDGWDRGDMMAVEATREEVENVTDKEWAELHECKLIKPFINTSEGKMYINYGDYIITEPFDKERGKYPCKPDIFKKTYDIIDEG